MYHILLRISALTVALVLLFDSGIMLPATEQLSKNTQLYVSNAIGVRAGVSPNELNTLTAELTARERELSEREANLSQREISVGLQGSQSSSNVSTYILSAILFVLLVLIVMNYALDYLRTRPRAV